MTIDQNDPIMGIGIIAKKLGITAELLRVYEREGLIIPYKTKSGYRFYSEKDIEWIECFRKQITKEKMNIAGVRLLLALMPCWKLKSGCNIKDCQGCKAYKNSSVVCWTLTDQESDVCKEENCRECNVYRSACKAGKLKKMYVVIEDDEKN